MVGMQKENRNEITGSDSSLTEILSQKFEKRQIIETFNTQTQNTQEVAIDSEEKRKKKKEDEIKYKQFKKQCGELSQTSSGFIKKTEEKLSVFVEKNSKANNIVADDVKPKIVKGSRVMKSIGSTLYPNKNK